MPTLVDIISTDPMYKTFAAALGVVAPEGLPDGAPFTLFVPTDDAFTKIPAETLAALIEDPEALGAIMLRRHGIVGKSVAASDIMADKMIEVDNAAGEKLMISVEEAGVLVKSSAGTALVVVADIMASDGVIHAIDTVI